jgi:nucleoside 2-deoxyribosyltransferase
VPPGLHEVAGTRLPVTVFIERIDDQPEAGVIDNIMRQRIRNAPFVIADLTHANNGAYWEAGFAEGLGKPVIYLCKQTVWEERRTHFDTNHCTTLMWDDAGHERFSKLLVASIRNSLKRYGR